MIPGHDRPFDVDDMMGVGAERDIHTLAVSSGQT